MDTAKKKKKDREREINVIFIVGVYICELVSVKGRKTQEFL